MNIVLNDKNYELPLRTPKVAKLFDDFSAQTEGGDVQMHYKACAVIEGVLGRAALKEIFGTSDREQISVVDSVIAVKMIDDVYMAPLRELEKQRQAEEMNSPSYTALSEMLANAASLNTVR